jgi:uncharacterized protein YbjT (DUF2867 family)
MRIVIAGGHGKIALLLARRLTDRGDSVLGLVRNPDHLADVEQTGADAAVCDLEDVTATTLAGLLGEADAVVFAAGAGPASGTARKDSVDRGAAVLLARAAEQAGVRRYLLVSSMGVDDELPAGTDEVWAAYLQAKKAAEDEVRAAELDWTVLRPGRLTDDMATGSVTLAEHAERGAVPRGDVAAVLVALLDTPASVGRTLELVGGQTPIADALGF